MSKKADHPGVIKAKAAAKHLHSLLVRRVPDISLGEVLNIYARMNGSKDWNTMCADLVKEEVSAAAVVEEVGQAEGFRMAVAPPEIKSGRDLEFFLGGISLHMKATRYIEPLDPDFYMTWYHIDIIMRNYDDDSSEDEDLKLGEAQAAFINVQRALEDGEDIFDVFDAHSQEMEGLFYAVYDGEGYQLHGELEFSDPIMADPDIVWGYSFLFIESISLSPAFVGMGIEKVVVRAIIDELANDGGLVVIDAGATATLPMKANKGEYKKYWGPLGFSELQGNYMYCNLNYVIPSTKQLIEALGASVNALRRKSSGKTI